MRTEKQLLKELKKVTALKNSNEALIAYKLGYKSNLTIRKWVERESIPTWCLIRLDFILDELLNINQEKEFV